MGCKKRTIQYAKWAGKLLGGVVVRRIAQTVDVIENAPPGWLVNTDKRRLVIEEDGSMRDWDSYLAAGIVSITVIRRARRR